jgi:hypothetical protein
MFKKINDYNFGINKELQLLPTIKQFLNDNTIYKLENSNEFDFKGDNKYIELKSRRNKYNKFSSTMVGLNKIQKASTLNEYVYFFFSFEDGLYYWLYDKDYELEIKQGGRWDRGNPEIKAYAYIPIELLIKID